MVCLKAHRSAEIAKITAQPVKVLEGNIQKQSSIMEL